MNLKDAEPLEASLNHCDTRRADLKVTLGLFDAPAILTQSGKSGRQNPSRQTTTLS